jgi:NADH-quinone oxidoreductase subunit A
LVDYAALLFLFGFAVFIGLAVLFISTQFGPRNPSRWKNEVYEAGSEPLGDARIRLDVKFYMVAISFIMFDIEAVFLVPWAVTARETGAYGFGAALVFIGILVIGLVYEWQKGGLEWD